MNEQLEKEILVFLEKNAKNELNFGEDVYEQEFNELSPELLEKLPHWYIEMLTNYPLAYQVISIPHVNPEFKGDYHVVEIAGPQELEDETLDGHPGCAIFELGYICIGQDADGMGNPFFISVHEGENPPVYQIAHDVGKTGQEILEKGKVKIVGSLAELFQKGELI